MSSEVVDAFLAGAPPAIRAADRAALASAVDRHLAAARAAWPDLAVPEREFARHLAGGLADDATLAELDGLRGADVYLAFACARGDAEAIARFEAAYFGEIDVAAASTRAPSDLVAEAKAHLRSVMFVGGDDRPPATRDFAGRGDLRGWVRVSALRHLLRLLGRARRELTLDDDHLLGALSPADDPELGYIRDLYRDAFAAAFRRAVESLDRRDKSLLRYQLVDGLSIDDIGALHGVHRATAARWLAAAREAIATGTRRELAAALGIAGDEIESIIRLVRSRIDVSLERLIGDG